MIVQLQALLNPRMQPASQEANAPPGSCGSQFAVVLSALLGQDQQRQGLAPPQGLFPSQGLYPPPTGVSEKTAPGMETGNNAAETDFCEEPDLMEGLPEATDTAFVFAAGAEFTWPEDEFAPIPGTEENLAAKGEPEQWQVKPASEKSSLPGTPVPTEQAAGAMSAPAPPETPPQASAEIVFPQNVAGRTGAEEKPAEMRPYFPKDTGQAGQADAERQRSRNVMTVADRTSEAAPGKNLGPNHPGVVQTTGPGSVFTEDAGKNGQGGQANNEAFRNEDTLRTGFTNTGQDRPEFQIQPQTDPANETNTAEYQTRLAARDLDRGLPKLVFARLQEINESRESRDFVVRLEPKELGRLVVKLTSRDGVVSVKIYTENAEARMLLDGGMQSLRQSFLEQGIKYGQMDVELGGQYISQNQHRENHRQRQGPFREGPAGKNFRQRIHYSYDIESVGSAPGGSTYGYQGLVDCRI